MSRNTDPSMPWNDRYEKDNPSEPWNHGAHKDDPAAPWNNPGNSTADYERYKREHGIND